MGKIFISVNCIGGRTYASPAPKANEDLANGTFNKAFVKLKNAPALGVRVDGIVYARHGRELMGFKSPVSVPMRVGT